MNEPGDRTGSQHAARYHLLQKTELRIGPVSLSNANLNEVAAAAADTLGIDRAAVFVTDVRGDSLTIDILRESIAADSIVGQRDELLRRLAGLPGIRVTEATAVSSDGMLGWIAQDGRRARRALRRTQKMAEEVRRKLQRRAIVFSTGAEVAEGQIEDTNTPIIMERLEADGYSVAKGPPLKDDEVLIAGVLGRVAIDEGYALVVTTGGVGAEDKDCTIEALLVLDPEAATPYLCRFEIGTGRHRKDGVRIGVGRVAESLIVALPGPNDEVRASLEPLIKGVSAGLDKRALAEEIAGSLRGRLRGEMKHPISRPPPGC